MLHGPDKGRRFLLFRYQTKPHKNNLRNYFAVVFNYFKQPRIYDTSENMDCIT